MAVCRDRRPLHGGRALAGAIGINILLSMVAAFIEAADGNYGQIGGLLVAGTLLGTLVSLPIAYFVGLVPAGGVGLFVAVGDRRGRGVSWRHALAATVFFLVVAAILAASILPFGALPTWLAGLLAAHLLATAICTALARKIFGPSPA